MHISPVTSFSVGISRNKVRELEKFLRSRYSLLRTFCLQQRSIYLITLKIFKYYIKIKFRNRIGLVVLNETYFMKEIFKDN